LQEDYDISGDEFFVPILEDNRENLEENKENSYGRGHTVFDYTFNFKEMDKAFGETT
jgi:hypothetical protein